MRPSMRLVVGRKRYLVKSQTLCADLRYKRVETILEQAPAGTSINCHTYINLLYLWRLKNADIKLPDQDIPMNLAGAPNSCGKADEILKKPYRRLEG